MSKTSNNAHAPNLLRGAIAAGTTLAAADLFIVQAVAFGPNGSES